MRPINLILMFFLICYTVVGYAQDIETIRGTLTDTAPESEHEIPLNEGQYFSIDLLSEQFDAFLKVSGPDGRILTNDDYNGTDSRIESIARSDGIWTIMVSSFGFGDDTSFGEYELRIETSSVIGAKQSFTGTLDKKSYKLGLYASHELELKSGQTIYFSASAENSPENSVSLSSYLHDPDGDFTPYGSIINGSVEFSKKIPTSGSWVLYVVDNEFSQESIPYEADLFIFDAPDEDDLPDYVSFLGELGGADSMLIPSGEYVQVHTLSVDDISQDLIFELSSETEDLDTYLIIITPDGQPYPNDDSDDPVGVAFPQFKSSDSRIEFSSGQMTAKDIGEWEIIATSFSAEATGKYEIRFFRE